MDNCVDIDPFEFEGQGLGLEGTEQRCASPSNFVESLVNTNKVVIFSKTSCPHCLDSKSLLKDMGVDYMSVELDKMEEGSQVQNKLGQITDARTVPRIFINGQCVGGNSDLQSMGTSGQLQDLLLEKETEDSLMK